MNALSAARSATQNTPPSVSRRAEDSVRTGSRSTQPEFELPDPLTYATDTEYQHKLLLALGELEAARLQFSAAAAASVDRLPAVVSLAADWVHRLAEALTAQILATESNDAVTDALAAAGQFLHSAQQLRRRSGRWVGLFSSKPAGGTRDRVQLLSTVPDVFERLLVALALGFRMPEFTAGWVTTATTFARELRRDLAWANSTAAEKNLS